MGKKGFGKHQATEKSLKLAFAWLHSLPDVRKVILGRFTNCGHRQPPGKILVDSDVPAGLKLKAYGSDGVREVYVYMDDNKRDVVRRQIEVRE